MAGPRPDAAPAVSRDHLLQWTGEVARVRERSIDVLGAEDLPPDLEALLVEIAVVLVQHQFALEHENEFVLVGVGVTQRRGRVRLDARDIDVELGEPNGIADALLLTPRNDPRELLGVRGNRLRRNFCDIDLGHGSNVTLSR